MEPWVIEMLLYIIDVSGKRAKKKQLITGECDKTWKARGEEEMQQTMTGKTQESAVHAYLSSSYSS